MSTIKSLSLLLAIAGLSAPGCASFDESAERDTLTAEVGTYAPPPADLVRVRVGVPPFVVTEGAGGSGQRADESVDDLAADQLTTLAQKTGRFRVIERAQMGQLRREWDREGEVRESERARGGDVRGIDLLFYGKVTNLRTIRKEAKSGFSLGGLGGSIGKFSAFGKDSKKVEMTVECGVDLRLVDPSTGEVVVSEFSEFKRTDTANSMGVSILGFSGESDASIDLSEDNKGKVLRLALHDTLRKMLPAIDAALLQRQREAGRRAPAKAAAASAFCGSCGAKLDADAKFCGGCGAKAGE